jgi:DnaJ-class molecular chaperone
MAFIDFRHDYYADLELQTNASQDDIENSFQNLGLGPETSK